MKISGGNYGGYVIEGTNAVLYENGVVTDAQPVTVNDTDLIVNGWVYNQEGIFIGME